MELEHGARTPTRIWAHPRCGVSKTNGSGTKNRSVEAAGGRWAGSRAQNLHSNGSLEYVYEADRRTSPADRSRRPRTPDAPFARIDDTFERREAQNACPPEGETTWSTKQSAERRRLLPNPPQQEQRSPRQPGSSKDRESPNVISMAAPAPAVVAGSTEAVRRGERHYSELDGRERNSSDYSSNLNRPCLQASSAQTDTDRRYRDDVESRGTTPPLPMLPSPYNKGMRMVDPPEGGNGALHDSSPWNAIGAAKRVTSPTWERSQAESGAPHGLLGERLDNEVHSHSPLSRGQSQTQVPRQAQIPPLRGLLASKLHSGSPATHPRRLTMPRPPSFPTNSPGMPPLKGSQGSRQGLNGAASPDLPAVEAASYTSYPSGPSPILDGTAADGGGGGDGGKGLIAGSGIPVDWVQLEGTTRKRVLQRTVDTDHPRFSWGDERR